MMRKTTVSFMLLPICFTSYTVNWSQQQPWTRFVAMDEAEEDDVGMVHRMDREEQWPKSRHDEVGREE